MQAPTYDIALEQSTTYKFNLSLTDGATIPAPLDITNWTFLGQIKEQPNVAVPPIATFTITVLDLPSALVEVYLPASEAEKLVKGRYQYDIIAKNAAVSPLEVYRLLQGKVTVDLAVTGLN